MRALVALVGTGLSAVLGLTLVAPAAPAGAVVTGGSTSAGDVVLYDQCQTQDIDYSLQQQGSQYWRLQIQVFDPDGLTSEGRVVTSDTGPPQGTVQMTFCGSETPGQWQVQASVRQGTLGANQTLQLPTSFFTVRPSTTSVSLKRKAARHQVAGSRTWKLVATGRRETPTGLRPTQGLYVRLEKLVDGQWVKLRSRDLTTAEGGRATTRVRVFRATSVRAVLPAFENYSGSISPVVRLKR